MKVNTEVNMRRRFMSFKEGVPIDINNYLTIEALEDGLAVNLHENDCEYCIDGDGNWKVLPVTVFTKAIGIGHTLSFRGELTPKANGIGKFTISKKCNLLGNCMSMLFGDNAANNFSLEGKDYAFLNLFVNCTNIVNVSADFLPSTTLTYRCYAFMFYGCTSLVNAPELPATTLADSCYSHMFYGCSKLNFIKMLATDISEGYCLNEWVDGVSSEGTFVKHPNMTSLPTGVSGIPAGWTVINA